MPRKLSDRELTAIVEGEIRISAGYTSGELARERSDALEAYLGEPYGDEQDGRSQVVTREVLEAVEDLMPSLMRVFSDAENLFEFKPVGPNDVDLARQESWRVNEEFWETNDGFYNLYTFIKDALLTKTGILKVWWDDTEKEERVEYTGLDEMEVQQLLSGEDGYEREILDDSIEITEEGINIAFSVKPINGRVRIEPVAPENFGVSEDARSPYAKDADFSWDRKPYLREELLEMGYKKSLIDKIPRNNDIDTEETLSRRHLTDEQHTVNDSTHEELERVWVSECYIRIDANKDGIPELLKVVLANSSPHYGAGSILLDREEVDRIPYCTTPVNLLQHKFYGLSVADLVMDIQRINTTLTRGILDNTYLSNNQRTAANRNVNLDDLLVSRPGGVVRTKGESPPLQNMAPIPTQAIPQATFALLERMDNIPEQRVGSGSTSQLDPKALSNLNVGVAAMALDQSKAKVELMARIIAEIGLRDCFRDIHELLQKNWNKPELQEFEGEWVEINPAHWRTRDRLKTNVGIGIANRERKQLAIQKVLERHAMIAQMGGVGVFVSPENIHNALEDESRLLGLTTGRYFQDPTQAKPRKEEPNIELLTLQANQQAAQGQLALGHEKNKVEMFKIQAQMRMQQQKDAADQAEMQMRKEIEVIEMQTARIRESAEAGNENARLQLEFQEKRAQNRIDELNLRIEQIQGNHDRAMDKYKADLDSATKLTLESMKQGEGEAKDNAAELAAKVQELTERLAEQEARPRGGRATYDEDGNIVSIGDIPVHYDDDGELLGVGNLD